MSSDSWPYSAATTLVLSRLRDGNAPQVQMVEISRVAVKELVLRGHLRIIEVKKRRMRKTQVIVATAPPGSVGPLPVPLGLLAAAIPPTDGDDMASLIRAAAQADRKLFSDGLYEAIQQELFAHGVAEQRKRKVLGLISVPYPGATAAGQAWVAAAQQRQAPADALADQARRDPSGAARIALGLGALVLLAPAGLSALASISGWWRNGGNLQIEGGDDLDFAAFNVLDAVGGALESVADSLGDAFGSLDAAFDSVGSAVDSAIDSGVSDGGGGGDSGGSDGGGGGCGGGGD